jgi:hypothetical protein
MHTNKIDVMFSIGYGTVVLYLASLTFFMLAAIYPDMLIVMLVLGTVFFVIPSVIIGVMVKMRIGT